MCGERIFAAALAVLMVSAPAAAVTDTEFSELREQLKQLKEQYENRIRALEQRLGEVERAARAGPPRSALRRALARRPSASRLRPRRRLSRRRRQLAPGRARSTPRSR